MRSKALAATLAVVAVATVAITPVAAQDDETAGGAQVGVRPLYLVDDMADCESKDTLAACAADPCR